MITSSGMLIDPREALDETLTVFKIKAADLSRSTGVAQEQISRYRSQQKDMNSLFVFKIIDALPTNAKMYFWHLLLFGKDSSFSVGGGLKVTEKPKQYSV